MVLKLKPNSCLSQETDRKIRASKIKRTLTLLLTMNIDTTPILTLLAVLHLHMGSRELRISSKYNNSNNSLKAATRLAARTL